MSNNDYIQISIQITSKLLILGGPKFPLIPGTLTVSYSHSPHWLH